MGTHLIIFRIIYPAAEQKKNDKLPERNKSNGRKSSYSLHRFNGFLNFEFALFESVLNRCPDLSQYINLSDEAI